MERRDFVGTYRSRGSQVPDEILPKTQFVFPCHFKASNQFAIDLTVHLSGSERNTIAVGSRNSWAWA